MSAFSTDTSEYLDICICMFMDFVRHAKAFDCDSRWQEFIKKGMLLGLKATIYPIYLMTPVDARIKYKMLASTLRGGSGCYIHIRSSGEDEIEPLPSSKIVNKDIVKKIFKKVKEVRLKTSMPITEARLDKIIDYIVEQERKERENG